MKANNVQKIKELTSILQQIVSRSKTAKDYVIRYQEMEYGTLVVEVFLKDENCNIFWKTDGVYFKVLCDVKLILYPLL